MKRPSEKAAWVDAIKRLGGLPLALILLDVVKPIAPALAQGLFVAQPLARVWNGGDALGELAEMLEAPDGVEQMRRQLLAEEELGIAVDDSTLRVFSILFVAVTAILVYTARFFQARPGRRANRRLGAALERMPAWVGQAIETDRPLHLGFGGAAVGAESTPVATAQAEFFYHIIRETQASDSAPLISTASSATVPLAQDTIRRAWEGEAQFKQVHWYPQGERSIAYAAAVSALTWALSSRRRMCWRAASGRNWR